MKILGERESADKPGSVVEQSFIWDARHRAPQATYPGTVRTTPVFPYLVLLRMGFTLPCLLPAMRCALTTPFHPYPAEAGRYIFCGTFRRLSPPRRYLASCPAEPGLSSPTRYAYPIEATAWPTPQANITDMHAHRLMNSRLNINTRYWRRPVSTTDYVRLFQPATCASNDPRRD